MGQVLLPGASGQWLASLTDAGISSDLQASLADGVLTFAEASKLVQDVIARGPLTASELSGLQSIVANLNLSFSADNYTANALTHFVSAGAANATWNGGTATATSLGDLQAGMSGALLSQLYGKWFTGADMPDPTMVAVAGTRGTVYPVHYTSLGYPLFGSNGPVAEDVNQGFEGTCVVLSAMLLMIKNHPDQLRSMFHDNGDGSWGVRFYINGSEYWETVNAQLPERDPGILVYANQGTSTSPSIWAELIEKAYAQLSATGLIGHTASVDSYANINTNQMYTVLKAFTGASATRYYYASDSNWYDDKQLIIAALANGDDVMMATGPATTDSSVDAAGNTLLVGDHAYAVERYDAATGNFVVRNPFGQQASGQYWLTEFEVSMADIVKVHGEVCIDNTARTPVRVSEIQSISNGASWPWAHITAGTANRIGGLFSVTDTNGKDITQYALEAIGTDQINLNGATNLATAAQQAQNTVVVSASDLSKLTFAAAATTGQTTLMIAASDGTDWSPMSRLILDIQASRVLTSPAVHAAVAGQTVPITKLVAYDSSVNMSSDRFSFIATPGLIQLNGATNLWVNPPTGGIYVSATDLQKLTVAVPASGVIDIQAHAYSGGAWSAWTEVVVQAAQPVAQSIQNYDNGQTTGSHAVGDTAANIFASIDGLQQMMISGAVDTVLVTDKPSSAIALSEKQWQSDMGVLSVTSGTFSLALNGLTATEAATMPSVASSHVASVTVTDSLANVATRLDALHTLAAAEAVNLGMRAGIDPHVLVEAIGKSAGASTMFNIRAPMMADRRFQPAPGPFTALEKYLHLASERTDETGSAMPLFSAAAPYFRRAVDQGIGEKDISAVITLLEQESRNA